MNFLSDKQLEIGEPLTNYDIETFINRGLGLAGSEQIVTVKYENLNQLDPNVLVDSKGVVVFFTNPQSNVGHFTLLRNDGDYIEYMDPMGGKTPDETMMLIGPNLGTWQALWNTMGRPTFKGTVKKLQSNWSNVCGKYCISRLMASRITQEDWVKNLTNRYHSSDYIVDSMYIIPYHDDSGSVTMID
ncbi:hypothetical protein 2 [Drosophila-associated adintovirus 3]|uniref:Uncharacterized protein n=1 Tax=Drosophila-associated adintovirus 3 TaxID=2744818 RepID=A0A7D4VFD8_9VIRU|nr:hypothetical protein 2 [Drosophila-associated adintovirus 3]